MKIFFKRFTAGLCFAVLVLSLGYISFKGNTQRLFCSQVLRLHILACSDSAEDIGLKHKVQNELMPYIDSTFSSCESFEDAVTRAQDSSSVILQKTREILQKNGSDMTAEISVGQKSYNTRMLGGFVYPEGEYCSVTLTLGEGNGKNVWCVLFSPLSSAGIEWQEGDGGDDGKRVKLKLKLLQWLKGK